MLPSIRNEDNTYAIPIFDVKKEDVADFMEELRTYHAEFADCFQRSEPRESFFQYMVGQLSEMERKSIEPIAINVENAKVRAMQRAISDTPWDDEKLMFKYRSLVVDEMGDPEGVLIFDESGFPKKGDHSLGVSRQYCGATGKVDNCQVGVFAAYASPHGYALLDKRLFVPNKWFTEEYAEKRKKCQAPPDLTYKTKPQLAADIFKDIVDEDIIPFKYITADCLYGNSREFVTAIAECIGKTYFVSIHSNTKCWLQKPVVIDKKYQYKGEIRSKKLLEDTAKKPITVEALAKGLNDYFWYRRKVSEGTKGPIEYEFCRREVVISKDELPWKTVWLIVKRSISDRPEYSYYISNALRSTRLNTFVWLSGMRTPIEQCFEETKSELGMDHYEVRKFQGWHHHVQTCMLGHFFLWHLKIRLGKKSTSYYAVAA